MSHHQFAGEVMTSFNYVMIPTRGNLFQTNSLEHESGNWAHLLCFTNGKAVAVQLQIWSTFVAVLWLCKTKIQDRVWILILARVLWWVMISRINWQFWYNSFTLTFTNSSIFYPIGITWRKWRWSSLFEISVKETVTFAYMTFHFPSE